MKFHGATIIWDNQTKQQIEAKIRSLLREAMRPKNEYVYIDIINALDGVIMREQMRKATEEEK